MLEHFSQKNFSNTFLSNITFFSCQCYFSDQNFQLMDNFFQLPHINSIKELQMPLITIGYYPIRGKAQVPRLLCQYLGVAYEDKLYDLAQWDKFKRLKTNKWDFSDLPYLQEDDFILTQAFPISQYIIERFGSKDLLGKTQKDQGIVEMYLWNINSMNSVISLNCTNKNGLQFQLFKQKQWKNCVLPELEKYEEMVRGDNYFLDYLTIIDFSIYQLIRYMQMLFPTQIIKVVPKLNKIKRMVENIPQILSYENSSRAVKDMDPKVLKEKFKYKN